MDILKLWKEYGFEIILIGCIVFILVVAVYKKIKGETGTWSDSYYYDGNIHSRNGVRTFTPVESKGEAECRRVLQLLFQKPFNKARPNFLNNPVTGGLHNLEIDCFEESMKLGVEYNGIQHYKFSPYFHKNKEAFLNQKYRDNMKASLCKDNGVTLVTVPYTVKVQNIEEYLKNELRKVSFLE